MLLYFYFGRLTADCHNFAAISSGPDVKWNAVISFSSEYFFTFIAFVSHFRPLSIKFSLCLKLRLQIFSITQTLVYINVFIKCWSYNTCSDWFCSRFCMRLCKHLYDIWLQIASYAHTMHHWLPPGVGLTTGICWGIQRDCMEYG